MYEFVHYKSWITKLHILQIRTLQIWLKEKFVHYKFSSRKNSYITKTENRKIRGLQILRKKNSYITKMENRKIRGLQIREVQICKFSRVRVIETYHLIIQFVRLLIENRQKIKKYLSAFTQSLACSIWVSAICFHHWTLWKYSAVCFSNWFFCLIDKIFDVG